MSHCVYAGCVRPLRFCLFIAESPTELYLKSTRETSCCCRTLRILIDIVFKTARHTRIHWTVRVPELAAGTRKFKQKNNTWTRLLAQEICSVLHPCLNCFQSNAMNYFYAP